MKVIPSVREWNTGNVSVGKIDSYIPNFECSTDANGKGIVNGYVGLLTLDEAMLAGCKLYNSSTNPKNENVYLYNKNGDRFWFMSPVGVAKDYPEEAVWAFYNGNITSNSSNKSNYFPIRPVISLRKDTLVTGKGTIDDKYVIYNENDN